MARIENVGRGFRSPPGSATALGRNRPQTPRQEKEKDKENEKDWIPAGGKKGGDRNPRPTFTFCGLLQTRSVLSVKSVVNNSVSRVLEDEIHDWLRIPQAVR